MKEFNNINEILDFAIGEEQAAVDFYLHLASQSKSEQTKKILIKHGAKEPLFGVKIEDLKKILKGEKGNNPLALQQFRSGNYDAM